MNGRPRSPFTDQQLIALHKKGLNDVEIARELGVRDSAIFSRRRKLGLKTHGRRLLFTDQQLKELHEQGFNDYEIAEKLGVDRSWVSKRRMRLGLKSNFPRYRTRDSLGRFTEKISDKS